MELAQVESATVWLWILLIMYAHTAPVIDPVSMRALCKAI